MPLDLPRMIARMEAFPAALAGVAGGLSDADARWKPADGAWSVLEVVAHLGDEETLDFGTRVRMTLEDPAKDWPPIDPEGWARERRYNERDLGAELARFAAARVGSVAWLRALGPGTDWSRARVHPKFGPMAAGMLMTSWGAHDALHLRQVARRLFQMAERDGGGYPTVYAGAWGA